MKEPVDTIEHPSRARGFLRDIHRFCCGIAGLTVCLLSALGGKTAEVAEPAPQIAQRTDRGAQPYDVLPEVRGRPSPQLPPVQPSPAPPSDVGVPVVPAQPSSEATPPLKQGPRFVLRDVNIVGNTVLNPAAIHDVVAPYLGKSVTTGDLEEIRRQLTLLYINSGYINSGAVIPDQNVVNGVVTFRFVEGRVTDIDVSGTDHFDPEFFRSRLARGIEPPFNVGN